PPPSRCGTPRRRTARTTRPHATNRVRARARDARLAVRCSARRPRHDSDACWRVVERRDGGHCVALRGCAPAENDMSTDSLVTRAAEIAEQGRAALDAAATLDDLAEAERRFIGKSSPLNDIR